MSKTEGAAPVHGRKGLPLEPPAAVCFLPRELGVQWGALEREWDFFLL